MEGMALAISKRSCFVLGSSKEMLGMKGEKMSVLVFGVKNGRTEKRKTDFLVEMRKEEWKMMEV